MNEAPDLAHEAFVAGLPIWIRPCRVEDLPELEWCDAHREHREIAERAFAEMERSEQLIWVADMSGFLAGQICLDLSRDRLWAARVFPALRGRGIASRLARVAERELTARGRPSAWVAVEVENTAALRFWMREGYRLMPVPVQSTVQLLEKDLTGAFGRAAISPTPAPLEPVGQQAAAPSGARGAGVAVRRLPLDSWLGRGRRPAARSGRKLRRPCR
jgi:GNAT superfamily N-acetyltransferase